MACPSDKGFEKKEEMYNSESLESGTTAEEFLVPNLSLHKTGLEDKKDKHDMQSSPVRDKTGDILKQRKAVPLKENNRREVSNKYASKTSRIPHSTTKEEEDDTSTSKSSTRRSTKSFDHKVRDKRRTNKSGSKINDTSHPNTSKSNEIHDKTVLKTKIHQSKANVPDCDKSELNLAQSTSADDNKSTTNQRPYRSRLKIKENKDIAQPSNPFDHKGISKSETNQSEANTIENKSESNVPQLTASANEKDVSKTRTHQSKVSVKENKSKLKLNVRNVKTEKNNLRLSTADDDKDISMKKIQQSKVKFKEKQLISGCQSRLTKKDDKSSSPKEVECSSSPKADRQKISASKDQKVIPSSEKVKFVTKNENPENRNKISRLTNKSEIENRPSSGCQSQLKKEDDKPSSRKEVEYISSSKAGRQKLSASKDKNIKPSSEKVKFVAKNDNPENCITNSSRLTNKSEMENRPSSHTSCRTVAKRKSSISSRSKATKATEEKSDRSIPPSSTINQLSSKENKERKGERLSAHRRIKSLNYVKQSLPSKNEEVISNKIPSVNTMKPTSEETKPELSLEEENVIKCKFESQDFSKTKILNLSIPQEIENAAQKCKTIKANVTIRNTNSDEDINDQEELDDLSPGVVEAKISLSCKQASINTEYTSVNVFDLKSTDGNEESITRTSCVNKTECCSDNDGIAGFNDLTEEEKGNTYQNNDILKGFHETDRTLHKLAWTFDKNSYNGKDPDIVRQGKMVLPELWTVQNSGEINGARPKHESHFQAQRFSKRNPLKVTDMTFLKGLLDKEPSIIVEELLKRQSLLNKYTEIATLDDSLIDLFLQVLSKAFVSKDYVIVLELFEYLKTSGFFDQMFDYLKFVIIRIKTKHTGGEYIQRIIENLLIIQEVYLNRSPSSFITFRKPHVIIGSVIEELDSIESLDYKIAAKYQNLTESIKGIEKSRKNTPLPQSDMSEPHDDYRHYSISPTVDEITGVTKPFLRPIKATGSYEDLHDYLDVHFRLLREDFVGPLREGISGLIKIMSAYKGKASNSEQLKDLGLKIYENVRVLSPVITQQGLCYKMKLKMTANLKNVEWDVSKRLIYGSMVCLTDKDFTEFFMATVVEREVKDIKRGVFVVHFETQTGSTETLLNRIFIMAETSGYFEAYRHVLSSLQMIKDRDLPFEKYIVGCRRSVGCPEYLEQNKTYDLRPLVDQDIKLRATKHLCEEIKVDVTRDVEFSPDSNLAKDVHVTNYEDWPTKELLRMNESQYRAVQSALTREFAIVQGPPGTGKTYIGLQIARVLLHNKSIWTRTDKTSRPMLIVCYTNHALDQFLEGIVKFFDGDIVRVGARSSSTDLEMFNLKRYRKIHFKKGSYLAGIQYDKRAARRHMESQSACVQELTERIQIYQSDIVDEEILYTEIGDRLFDNLINGYKGKIKRSDFSYIVKWLGIEHMKKECMKEIKECQSKQKAKYVKVEDDTSRTIKDRMIDIDEDFHFSSKKRTITSKIREEEIAFYVNNPRVKGNVWSQESIRAKQFYKMFKTTLMSKITDDDVMSQEEADKIQNVWRINHQTKWRLYRLWIKNKCAELYRKIEERKANFEAAAKGYRDASLEVDKEIMRKAVIIGMTTSGAAKYQSVLQDIGPRIVVVEEAAEVLEAHIITTLSKKCEHLILIGDHKQLRPNPTVYNLVVNYNLDISLFERMVKNDIDFNSLELQHRMRPEIADIMRHIYPELKDYEHVQSYPNVKGISTNLFLINHLHLETCSNDIKSYSNHKEAEYAVALCRYILLQGYEREEITILTTYTGQLLNIRKLMPKEEFDGVHVTVVDNYQGEENKIVILSLVRSNTNAKIGFLKTENRICVALSRAKIGLYIIGNFDHLASQSSLWERITKDMKNKGFIGEGLALYCQNHPNDNAIVAKDSEDFQKAPKGGCLKKCETRLECGHKCESYCHVIDQEHKEIKCMKPCNNILCDLGHKCPYKCFIECSPCSVLMTKVIPNCGHTQYVPCAMQPEEFCCQEPCSKILECGHLCKAKCGESHTSKCYDKVSHTWPCGHMFQIMCWETKIKLCPQPCGVVLKCKHTCSGTCGSCFMGRVHQQCSHESSVTKLCGHTSSIKCQHDAPCSRPCENRCGHGKCRKTCGELCTPCTLSCPWRCTHKRCTNKCHEICNRTPCDFPCKIRLKCNHTCVGLCGEPCPNICRNCNRKKFKSITFGKKQAQSDNYVLLEQCGHLVEFRTMDAIVAKLKNSKALRCPLCNGNVKYCLRYGNNFKTSVRKIEVSKHDVTGNSSLYNRLNNSICTVTFQTSADSDTFKEIELGNISEDVAKTNFPVLFYKVLCKKEFGQRLDTLFMNESQLTLRQQLLTVEKQWSISSEIAVLIQDIMDMETELNEGKKDNNLISFLHQLVVMIVQPRYILTDQEHEDFRQEIQRGKTYLKCLKTEKLTLGANVIAKVGQDLKTIESALLGPSRFTREVERNINESIECIGKEIIVYMR